MQTVVRGLKLCEETKMKALKSKMVSVMGAALIMIPALQGVAGESGAPVKKQIVRYADLDLSAPAGVQMLYGRLKGAARSVCSQLDGFSLMEHARYRACVAEAVEDAVLAVDSPALTEAYLADTGRKPVSRIARRQ
jgi:UrcA family protein